ncbi:hypothetical protein C2S53_009846, partial [Perilla frutescens var. hirtella]
MGRRLWTRWLRLTVAVAAVTTWWQVANADPQTNPLGNGIGCSGEMAINASQFMTNLNATFSDLRTKLSSEKRFATAEHVISPDPVYGMAQCRNYMSEVDCVACYDFAVDKIRTNCSNMNGARAIFDGCFLRYEGNRFFARTNWPICGNERASEASAYREEGEKLLSDLQVATPRMNGSGVYFGASKRKVGNSTIYGVAQCTDTVGQAGCQGCLSAAYESLSDCLPYTDARLVDGDAACFMRYSNSPFFPDNQTTDLTPFLGLGDYRESKGSSINGKAVIGGALGGAGLLVIVVTMFIWFNFSTTLRKASIVLSQVTFWGQRPNRYSYNDLKAATNNFSEENKLGEGAFGAVYK